VRNHDSRSVRLSLALCVLALCLAVGASPAAAAQQGRTVRLQSLTAAVVGQINVVRRSHGLAPLRVSSQLAAAASQHSSEMARQGYFSHESAGGGAFWVRVRRYYPRGGFRLWSVGENLVWASPDLGAAGALRMWMASPEHRANLLSPRWREVGVSAVHASSAPGVYGGGSVTVVTADFGLRR
jgi:uncharacterized protein YkwD